MSIEKEAYLFVYGSLRSEFEISHFKNLIKYSDYYSKGMMQASLYEVNHYPALIENSDINKKVFGEIYRIKNENALFSFLDEYEGCSVNDKHPHEYTREKVNVLCENNQSIKAWVYLYNWPIEELEEIPSGDYVDYYGKEMSQN